MAKSKFFCIAVEGATTDGRDIDADWINQMAAGYNPATYTARINCEHLRGFSPDAPFNAYGSVLALDARDVQIQLDGKAQTRRGLFAQIDANDQLVAINKKGQKLFTSCEVSPKFAGTDKAYLVGLAVTDSPASLGTEMLKFAAGQGDANPFAARKLDKANLFSATAEASIQMDADTNDTTGVLASVKGLLDTFAAKFKAEEPAKPKEEPKPANDNDFAAFATAMGETINSAIGAVIQSSDAKFAALRSDFDTLKTSLERTEDTGFTRSPAPGGSTDAKFATDC